MTNTLSVKAARVARIVGFASVVSAATVASLIGFASVAHAAPAHTNPRSGMHGDPTAAASYWRYQVQEYDCGEMAVADVIGQITGNEPTEDEITATAANMPSGTHLGPIYAPAGRTANHDLVALARHYGVRANGVNTDLGALERNLDLGRKVIAGVNDKTIWDEPGNRGVENHFVVVTGIDTNANMVHLNDSGVRDGRDEQVPIATFEAAWATSDRFAVVAS